MRCFLGPVPPIPTTSAWHCDVFATQADGQLMIAGEVRYISGHCIEVCVPDSCPCVLTAAVRSFSMSVWQCSSSVTFSHLVGCQRQLYIEIVCILRESVVGRMDVCEYLP